MSSTFFGVIDENKINFSDGQPHIVIPEELFGYEYYLKCRLASPKDFINLALARELFEYNWTKVNLEIMYWWGRMDRRLSEYEPYTVQALASLINGLKFESVSIFGVHSKTSLDLIENNVEDFVLDEVFLDWAMASIINKVKAGEFSVVIPDLGASKRFEFRGFSDVVQLHKTRDFSNGKITGMKYIDGKINEHCVIVDDLCDGGRTFTEAAKLLKSMGASKVDLIVNHAILPKGYPPEINHIYTSNSFRDWTPSDRMSVFDCLNETELDQIPF